MIQSVINDLQTRTCLKFVKRKIQKNYISIVSPDENELMMDRFFNLCYLFNKFAGF